MTKELVENLKTLVADAEIIRSAALNRDDSRIQIWREKTREAIIRFAPVKLPAFDEIPFASDYFLSKPVAERRRINDRIALVSDFDAALKILRDSIDLARQEGVVEDDYNPSMPVATFASDRDGASASGLAEVRGLAANMGFSPRDLGEAFAALDQAEAALAAASPDWDRIKRIVKFFVDFDRKLALAAIPVIFSLYARRAGS